MSMINEQLKMKTKKREVVEDMVVWFGILDSRNPVLARRFLGSSVVYFFYSRVLLLVLARTNG